MPPIGFSVVKVESEPRNIGLVVGVNLGLATALTIQAGRQLSLLKDL